MAIYLYHTWLFFYFSSVLICLIMPLSLFCLFVLVFLTSPLFSFLMTGLKVPQNRKRENEKEREPLVTDGLSLRSWQSVFPNLVFFDKDPQFAYSFAVPCMFISFSPSVRKSREVTTLSKAQCAPIDWPCPSTTLSHQRLSPISRCLLLSFPSSVAP